MDDERRGLATAFAIANSADADDLQIVLAVPDEESGVATALPRDLPGDVKIHPFGILSRVCVPELVLRGTTETVARAQHESYSRALVDQGVDRIQAPFLVPWDQLPEEGKEKNRRFADHVGVKLSAAQCIAVPAALVDPDDPGFAFGPEEVERLAEMEHERWSEDHRLDGYRYAPVRDDGRKLHPSLVSWDELDDQEREGPADHQGPAKDAGRGRLQDLSSLTRARARLSRADEGEASQFEAVG